MSFHRVSFVLLVVVASSLCFSATLVAAALPENDAAVSTVAVDEVIFPESDMDVQPSTDTFSDFESEDFEESEDPLLEPNDQQATTISTQQNNNNNNNNNNKDGGDKLMSVSHKHHKMHSRSHKMAENLDYDPQEEGEEGDEDELHEPHHHHHRHHHHFLHKHCCFGVAAVIFLVAFLIRRKKQLAQRSLNMVDNASSVEVVCCVEGVPAEKSVAFQV
ncbi:GPI-anchored surface protein, putative [Bodo saltans]|uniref:GPI-anchored surface protein, putative n=1 Tax=Bodo saltans TaxID=75058 RepID=A0A0S4J690_BODSA|nr:GPI-anchored surface protein, putative [Bodo saltans]|eukprot:CUG85729.1 GPI-anchored surface protein, putative [Bodo saltans]